MSTTTTATNLRQTSTELLKHLTDTLTAYPLASTITTALLAALTWTYLDFRAWIAFGTGGTPPTWAGYVKMTRIRLSRLFASDDLHSASPLSTSGPSYLSSTPPLPRRTGPRPSILSRTMPQRQHPEPISPAARARLQSLMQSLATEHPTLLEVKPSKTEGGSTDAIYALPHLPTLNPLAKGNRILGLEIAHAHPADNSLHVWLAERDARAVIEAGWGMRFPLGFVHKGWTMVFAPRTEGEVEQVVERVVRAGVGWVTGVEI